jgi:hypothetical protein
MDAAFCRLREQLVSEGFRMYVGSVVIDCNDLDTQDQRGEVARLLELGAVRNSRAAEAGEDFVTLQDPEGNVFDVVDKAEG